MKRIYLLILSGFYSSLAALTLDESVSLAMQNATQLQEISYNKDIIELNQKSKSAKNFGEFEAVGSVDNYNLPRTLAPLTPASISPTIATTENLFSAGVKYSVQLFTGFAQTKSIELENIQRDSAMIFERLTKEQLVYNVKSIYLSIVSLEKQLDALRDYIRAQKHFLATVNEEVSLGRKAHIDALKVESELQESLTKEQALLTNATILKESLKFMIDTEVESLEDVTISVQEETFDIEHLDALQRSRALELSLSLIDKKIGIKNSYKYPQISFDAYYGQNFGFNDDKNPNEGDFNNQELWQFGLKIKYSLYDFGANSYETQALELQKLQIEAKNEGVKREILRDIKTALAQLNKSIADIKSTNAKYELLQESAKIEMARYEGGLASMNDLLFVNAQKELAKSSLIDAKYSYQKAVYYIEYILEKGVSDV
ncbi:MAG: TolC family protein [Sulfurimonas sp.]|nr:TolC family protein [Sulfurimonas sp.]